MRKPLAGCVLLLLSAMLVACAGGGAQWQAPPRWQADGTPILPKLPGGWARYQMERRLPAGQETFPMDAMQRAQAAIDRLPRFSTRLGQPLSRDRAKAAGGEGWEWLGPSNVAGRMRTLAFDPGDANRMIAGGVSGGLWLSEDGGGSWGPLSDAAANINIGALAIDPQQPEVIYAGTGELYRNTERPYSAMWGQGVLRSRDGGQSFQQLLATANDNFRYVSDLVISQHDPQRLYAATNSGVWRSPDGGNSWTQLLRPVDDADGLRYEGCNELLLLPDASADVLLAGCASRSVDDRYWLPNSVVPPACNGPCPAALYRSDDAAGTAAFEVVLTETGMGRTRFEHAPSSPNIVYAVSASIVPGFDRTGDGVGDYNNGLHAVFRSDDGGRTWAATLRNSSPDALSTYLLSYADGFEAPECGFGGRFIYGAGWYNMAIAVDPLDPEKVWVAGMEHYRSDDGGKSFGKASYWWIYGSSPYGVHADQHVLAFHPGFDGAGNRRLYSGNDGGLAMTLDARAPTTRGSNAACGPSPGTVSWQALIDGMGTLQFYSGAVAADGSLWLGGAQDNGTQLSHSGSGTGNWQHVFGGDGAFVAVDPRTPQRLYVSYQNITLHRSEDGGNTFQPATSGIADQPLFIMPYALDTAAPDRLWAAGGRLWRSNNRGDSWTAASTPPSFPATFSDRISALAVAPTDSNRVLAGNRRGIMRHHAALSTTGSSVWARVTPREGWVSSLAFDPHDADVAYATYSTFGGDHVWRSDDGGISWQPIDGNGAGRLPDLPVHTLAVDPSNSQRLYVGTDLGVFVTIDGGANWAVEQTGFPNVIVEALRVAPGSDGSTPHLYAFTYGRGAWRVALSALDGRGSVGTDASLSGAWFDPAQVGHGWLLESVVSDGVAQLVAAWYTYLDGEQRWLVGVAPVGRDSTVVPLTVYSGGDFPPDFDPAAVQGTHWGEVELQFEDADHGVANWRPVLPGYAEGGMPLQRLTTPATGGGAAGALSSCHNGSWFDPDQAGHGLMVQVLGNGAERTLVAVWYTFLDGKQAWLLGNGPIVGDEATLAMQITEGGDFPPGFDAAAVDERDWGTLRFRVLGANSAQIEWQAQEPGFADGEMALQRLTATRNTSCTSGD